MNRHLPYFTVRIVTLLATFWALSIGIFQMEMLNILWQKEEFVIHGVVICLYALIPILSTMLARDFTNSRINDRKVCGA